MKVIISVLFIVILWQNMPIKAQENSCHCKSVFDTLVQKLENNYIGLYHLKHSSKSKNYDTWKNKMRNEAGIIKSEDCTKFLQKFLNFFKDGHLFVYEQPTYSDAMIASSKKAIKDNTKNIRGILSTLDLEKDWIESNGLDGIIGKWSDGKSEIAIIKDEGFYNAYIINSNVEGIEPGELKAQFVASEKGIEGTIYSYTYTHMYVTGDLYKEKTLLVLSGGMYWEKLEPTSQREVNLVNKSDISLPFVQKLDQQNTLLSIPSFLGDAPKFNKVLIDHMDILSNTTNLIIDIRGNTGGNAIYFDLISAYATNPLPSSQGLVLASEDTKIYFENLRKYSVEIYDPLVSRIKLNMGNVVEGPLYPEKLFNPFPSKIQKVAILTDNGCASAAESFILHSKGSSTKVTTFGSPTAGVIDYTSVNIVKLESGSQNIYFGYPTSTLHKDIPLKGYNQTGIIPDVPIVEKTKDKVQYIVDWFKK